MEETPCIRIGHLKIIDHLLLGLASPDCSAIEPIAMNSWEQLTEALISKKIDGAFIPAPIAMHLFASGLNIRLLMFVHRAGSIIVKKAHPTLLTLTDFAAKTVLVPSEMSIQNMLLHRLLSSRGVALGAHDDPDADVAYEAVPPGLMNEMMASDTDHDIAGCAMPDPFATTAICDGLAQRICTTDKLWKTHPCCTFVVAHPLLQQQAAPLAQIVNAFVRTAKTLELPLEEKFAVQAQSFLDISRTILDQSLNKCAIRFDPDLLVPDMAALKTIAAYLKEPMGLLPHEIQLDKLVDSSLIQNALSGKLP